MKIGPEYCMGKKKYRKRDAETARNLQMRMGSDPLRIYQCNTCGFWHLTSKIYEKRSQFKLRM